jgi:hypothetical protein
MQTHPKTIDGKTLTLIHPTKVMGKPGSKARAIAVEARLKELYESGKRDFIETGRLIIEVEEQALWSLLEKPDGTVYSSLYNWMETALPYGRTTVIRARDVVRKFDGVDPKLLAEIPRVNLQRLARIPSDRKRKSQKTIKAALEMPEKKLVAFLASARADAAAEKPALVRMSFTFTHAEAKRVQKALDKVSAGDTELTKEEALGRIVTGWMSSQPGAHKKAA